MSVEVILAHANWCPHCKHFSPIFEFAKEKAKNNDFLKKYNVVFKSFDLAIEEEKDEMGKEYDDKVTDLVQGFPSVILVYDINKKKGIKTIETTVINNEQIDKSKKNKDELIETLQKDAADEFIDNVINRIKTEISDKKDLYVQGGGGINYKNKKNTDYYNYINYKIKYMELQKNI